MAGLALTGGSVLSAVLLIGLGLITPAAFADTTGDDGNLIVDVTDGVPPRPTPTRRPPFVTPGPPGAGPHVSGNDTQATIPDPVAADDALEDPVVSGPLAMGGLSVDASPSFALGNGTITLSFVIRNNADRPIDSTARFWVADVLGNVLVEVDEVEVDDLDAEETRRVLVEIEGLGQQAVLRSYVTFVPPAMIDDEPVAPISRNTVALVPPLFGLSLASGIAAAGAAAWWVVNPRGLGLRLRRFGP